MNTMRVRDLVQDTYDMAGQEWGCDPRCLAVGLGLSVCPMHESWPVRITNITGTDCIQYRWDGSVRASGINVFRGLAIYLQAPDIRETMGELILPTYIAKSVPYHKIVQIQTWVNEAYLADRYQGLRASGMRAKITP